MRRPRNLTTAEVAWCMKEFLEGKSQMSIARRVDYVAISNLLMKFYAQFGWWSNEFRGEFDYNKRRWLYFRQALDNYIFAGHEIVQPDWVWTRKPKSSWPPADHITDEFPVWYQTGRDVHPWSIFAHARAEHAWLLRVEGLKYREIGDRLGGLSNERTRQIIMAWSRKMARALRRTKFTIEYPGDREAEYFELW
jgi:hypothetical protein